MSRSFTSVPLLGQTTSNFYLKTASFMLAGAAARVDWQVQTEDSGGPISITRLTGISISSS
ncbi:MAG: hypothetical protein IPH33_19440 [Bacteroidetes bacterium]|nr:hypothetical protein [Bacteroidota bacterium]